MLRNLFIATTVASTLLLAGCGDSDENSSGSGATGSDAITNTDNTGNATSGEQGSPSQTSKTAVDVAVATPELSILVEAVVAADLVDTLSGEGPFTIFAPTNNAFAALLAELNISKDALLADNALLTSVLTYHVLDAEVKAADVPVGKAITPLGGSVFKIDNADNGLAITDGRNRTARIVATDVMADNGVIHLIDQVILPADKSIVETALANPDFSILAEAVVAAGLVDTLSGDGPFTVLAPTDAAFAGLLAELHLSRQALLADTELLKTVLLYHVLDTQVLAVDVPVGVDIATVQGANFRVDNQFRITDSRHRQSQILATDVFTSNGVIHVIDKVLLPH